MQNLIKYKWTAVSVAVALVLLIVCLCCCGAKQKYYELNCVYPDTSARYDFIIKDKNTAEDFRHGFPVTAKEKGTPVNCGDVKEYSNMDPDTYKILSKRHDIASALIHNPLGGINSQVEYMTLGGDLIGYSCLYIGMRYDCFTDEPFFGCPEALADAKVVLSPLCKSQEIE